MRRPTMLALLATISATLLASATLSAQPVPLTTGRAIRGTLAKGDTARYKVSADSNMLMRLAVDQIAVDAVVRVLSPTGRVMRTVNGPARGIEQVDLDVYEGGDYQIQVIPFKEEVGAYSITLLKRELLSSDPKRFTEQLLSRYDRTDTPGVVVSVWQGGKTLYSKAYGMANLTWDIPFRVDTRTNIGSTSKQFTALAVMLLVDQGKVRLDEDVRTYIPELPDLGKTVTVRNILTHTSGYREFLNELELTGRQLGRGDYIDRAEVISIVQRQPALQNEPGAEFNYNNTAFGLVAVIVERVSGMTFPAYMAKNVFGPLGMTHTLVRANPQEIVPGGAEGYGPGARGTWLALGDLGGSTGAGGIYTTVGDLQKWVENFAHPSVGTRAIFDQMMTPYTLSDGKSTGYGFGLFIDTQGALKQIQHGGADLAHRSQLLYYPEIDAGLTIQSNNASVNAGALANRISQAFFGAAMEPKKLAAASGEFDPTTFKAASFDAYVGRFALNGAAGVEITFTREGDSLFTRLTGQRRIPIVPTSDSTFALRGVVASLTFDRDDTRAVKGVTLHQNGRDQYAPKLTGPAAEAWTPSVPALGEFTGRFFSEELETFYDMVVKDSSLVINQRRMDPNTLAPRAADTFFGSGVTIEFERDRNGRVIGFYASNGRTRGVRFARVR